MSCRTTMRATDGSNAGRLRRLFDAIVRAYIRQDQAARAGGA
ncbi:MAG TPA: hypothetical protein VNB49_02625 [Candidatus Dormibacteraeota bacterium]|nr:hypothetical protein [Candidatus Dormibacteraeota bacterium]